MTLSDWLKDNDCNDEQRAEWAIQLAQLLLQCKDGNLNPERIDVDETGNGLSLNAMKNNKFIKNVFLSFESSPFSSGASQNGLKRTASIP